MGNSCIVCTFYDYSKNIVTLSDWISDIYNIKASPVVTFPNKHPRGQGTYGSTVVNLFDIIKIYSATVPQSEDWFINYFKYDKNEPWDTDVRHQNHYKKKTVLKMLNRLIDYNVLRGYYVKDIIKHSYDGEKESFFRPYYVVHVDFSVKGAKFIPDLYNKNQSVIGWSSGFLNCSYSKY